MTDKSVGSEFGGALLSTSIKRLLLDRIIDGHYAPGERIVELRLAKELGTSQSPVREALRDLAGLGLIEIQARQGARVRMPSNKELVDVSIVRSELDALAARLAVEVDDVALVEDLQQLVEEMAACIAADDHRSMALADAQFHGRIAEAADNVAVQRVFDQLEPFGRTFVTLMLPNVDVDGILHEHEVILSAIRSGDGPGAAAAARVHQLNVSSLLWSDVPAED